VNYEDDPVLFGENKPEEAGAADLGNLAEVVSEERLASCTTQKRRIPVFPSMCCPRCKIDLAAYLQDTAPKASSRLLLLCKICGIGWRIVTKSMTLVQARLLKENSNDDGVPGPSEEVPSD
jgi:hypothetical protein